MFGNIARPSRFNLVRKTISTRRLHLLDMYVGLILCCLKGNLITYTKSQIQPLFQNVPFVHIIFAALFFFFSFLMCTTIPIIRQKTQPAKAPAVAAKMIYVVCVLNGVWGAGLLEGTEMLGSSDGISGRDGSCVVGSRGSCVVGCRDGLRDGVVDGFDVGTWVVGVIEGAIEGNKDGAEVGGATVGSLVGLIDLEGFVVGGAVMSDIYQ
jgi:hypothetical protein